MCLCTHDGIEVQAQLNTLTLNLLTTTIVAPPSNASKWQMGFNLVFKGLIQLALVNVTPAKGP